MGPCGYSFSFTSSLIVTSKGEIKATLSCSIHTATFTKLPPIMFIISHGPDQEWFNTEEEAVDAAFDWSVEENGDTILVSRVYQGKTFPHMEVFA